MKTKITLSQIALLFFLVMFCGCQGGAAFSGSGNATGGAGFSPNVHVWKSGTIKVRNPNPFPVTVWVDGKQVGWLPPGGYSPMSVPQGEHTVNLIDSYGRIVNEFDESTDK